MSLIFKLSLPISAETEEKASGDLIFNCLQVKANERMKCLKATKRKIFIKPN